MVPNQHISTASLGKALEIMAAARLPFQRAGWLLALYGSCLDANSKPNDVDLLCVRWRPSAMDPLMLCQSELGCPGGAEMYKGMMAESIKFHSDRFGCAIDIQFRPEAIRILG